MNHALGELWPRMMSVAYRILGSVMDAEDAVQEAFVRLLATDRVTSLEGFLVKATSHCCFDRLRARRIRKNHARLSVPCFTTTLRTSGVEAVEESLSRAFLYMLERLTPVELAVFLLRTALDFEFVEIAEVLGKSNTHTRQILCRARSRLLNSEPRFARTLENADDVAERFVNVCRSGDITSIGQMLVEVPGGTRRDGSEPSCAIGVLRVSHRPAEFVSDTRGGRREDSPASAADEHHGRKKAFVLKDVVLRRRSRRSERDDSLVRTDCAPLRGGLQGLGRRYDRQIEVDSPEDSIVGVMPARH